MPFPALSPATAPTSFEGPFGKIVHQVRATIDTPRFSKDHQCSRVFYILSPLNLNSIPDIEVRMERWSPGWSPPLPDVLFSTKMRWPGSRRAAASLSRAHCAVSGGQGIAGHRGLVQREALGI